MNSNQEVTYVHPSPRVDSQLLEGMGDRSTYSNESMPGRVDCESKFQRREALQHIEQFIGCAARNPAVNHGSNARWFLAAVCRDHPPPNERKVYDKPLRQN